MTDLTQAEVRALHEALDDEYLAWSTYDQVIRDFGEVPPFSSIRDAEARHIGALQSVFARFGLPVPENPWTGKATRYASLQQACEAAVAAEIANRDLYERLLQATRRPEILAVFRNLQEASAERHLAAFRRCAGRSAGRGGGYGRRWRGGAGREA